MNLKKFSILIILLLLCTACEERRFDTTDETFLSYVDEFRNDHFEFLNKKVDFDVAINFATDLGEANANCYRYTNGKNEILVNPEWWNRITEGSKKALIYHELGHCALGQKHRNEYIRTRISSSMKASIMNSNAFGTLRAEGQPNYEVNEFYLYELFNNDQSIWEEFQ